MEISCHWTRLSRPGPMSSNRTGKTIGDVLDAGLCEGRVLTSAAAGMGGPLFITQLEEGMQIALRHSLGSKQMSMRKTSECCF